MTPGIFKRALDLTIASVGFLIVLPLLVFIAIAVKLTSPGPILYRGTRAGLNGAPFQILKFRTMVPNAESLGGSATAANDKRITALGAWLRQYKLDELPQLINIIKGEMSIVGPRPEVFRYVEQYDERNRRVLSVLPGLTDWASLWDIDEGNALKDYPDPEEAYVRRILPVKLALQHYYLDHYSLLEDLRIISYTLVRLLCPSWTPRRLDDAVTTAMQMLVTDCPLVQK